MRREHGHGALVATLENGRMQLIGEPIGQDQGVGPGPGCSRCAATCTEANQAASQRLREHGQAERADSQRALHPPATTVIPG